MEKHEDRINSGNPAMSKSACPLLGKLPTLRSPKVWWNAISFSSASARRWDTPLSLPSYQLCLPAPVLSHNPITQLFVRFHDISVKKLALMKKNPLKMTQDNCSGNNYFCLSLALLTVLLCRIPTTRQSIRMSKEKLSQLKKLYSHIQQLGKSSSGTLRTGFSSQQ